MRKILWKTLGILVLAGACAKAPETAPAEPDPRIALSDQFTGDYALIDQDGRAVADDDFHGKVAVVYFGFATCPDVCPMALSRLSATLNELSDAERDQIAPIFITVDPGRDTPAAVKAFLQFDPRITGLTGTPAAIDAARQSFKVYAQRQVLEGSSLDYTMNHSSLFYVVDRKGQPRYALNDNLDPPALAAILQRSIAGEY